MMLPGWAALDGYNFILAAVLFLFSHWRDNGKKSQNNAFNAMMISIMVLVITNAMSWSTAKEGGGLLVGRFGSFMTFLLDPALALLCLLYIDSWLESFEEKSKVAKWILFGLVALNFCLVSISSMFGFKLFFYYDKMGNYHRGSLYIARVAAIVVMFFVLQTYVFVRNKCFKKNYRLPMIFFPMPGVVLGLSQVALGGLPLLYVGIVLSYLIIYIYMQSRDVNEDYLTGAINRRKLDAVLADKVENCRERGFSGIMIDIDFFKDINDEFGHQVGDQALEALSSILHDSFRKCDVIARYGGDEFCVIADVADAMELGNMVARTRRKIQAFNDSGKTMFKLCISMGYAVYEPDVDASGGAFLKHLDKLMYVEKEAHHKERGRPVR